MEKEIVMTYAGLRALEDELEQLKTVKRKEVAEKIKVARGYGDLSENSEYDEAKNEQAMVESRIAELENMLKVAVVLNKDQIQRDVVSLGTSVKVKITEDGTEETALFQIVGSAEANPMEGRISDESPVGKALVGHRCGDKVNVETAYGVTVYEILAVDMTGD